MTKNSGRITNTAVRAKAPAAKGGRKDESAEGRHRNNGEPHRPGHPSKLPRAALEEPEIEREVEEEVTPDDEPEVVEDDDDADDENETDTEEELFPDDDAEVEDDEAPGDDEEDVTEGDGNDVEPEVGPANGRGTRDVICRRDNVEVLRHMFNTNNLDKLTKFIKDVAKEINKSPEELAYLRPQIIEKAEAADKAVAEAVAEQMAQAAALAANRSAIMTAEALEKTPPECRKAAKKFLRNPKLFEELARDIEALGVVGEWLLALAVYLIGTSRILMKPLGGLVQAASSTGKSYVSNVVIGMMPEEQVLKATDITGQALYYFTPGSLKHKLICVAERKHQESQDDAAAANAGLALREMFSSGELRKVVTVKEGGGMTAVEIWQEGPIAYMETTTQENIFGEDETRLMKLVADESPEQTERVIEQLQREAEEMEPTDEARQTIRLKHQTAQRLLRPLRVVIPYARRLNIPKTKVAARRAFGQLVGCIRAVALLRQFQKDEVVEGCIAADLEDYRVAHKIMLPVLRRVFRPISQRALELLAIIRKNMHKPGKFDRNDCVRWSGISRTEVRNRLALLLDDGAITQVAGGGPGQKCEYRVGTTAESHTVKLEELVPPRQLEKLIGEDEEEVVDDE